MINLRWIVGGTLKHNKPPIYVYLISISIDRTLVATTYLKFIESITKATK